MRFSLRAAGFPFASVDALAQMRVTRAQPASGGTLNVTFADRFVEILKSGEQFSLYRHLETGWEMELPNDCIWQDKDGRLCAASTATDYFLPVEAGGDGFRGQVLSGPRACQMRRRAWLDQAYLGRGSFAGAKP